MAKTANQALYDAAVRHQVHLLRFAEGQAQAAAAALTAAETELLEKITGAMAKGLVPSRLEALLTSVRERRAQVYEQLGKDMEEGLQHLSEVEAAWETSAIGGSSPVVLNLAAVPLEQLHAAVAAPIAGIPLKGWLDNIGAAEATALQAAVTQAVLQGETIDDLVRRIRGTKAKGYADGILSTSTRNAQALARTAVNHVSNSARELVWEANSDIVRVLRWTSTLDGRTSPICQSRDGHMAPIAGHALLPSDPPLSPPGARPPAHFNCRSLMVAVLDGVAIAGDRPFVADPDTRAARESRFRAEAKDRKVPIQQVRQEWADKHVGRVPAATTYQEWLKTQPASFQDEVMGKAKAQMFRDGLPLERFVDKSGRALSLAELKAEVGGDALNVIQPAIGVKAKGLLMQGMEPADVLAAIKAEFPGATTSAASIASYKSELKKAGLLHGADKLTSTQKSINFSTQSQLHNFEDNKLPVGVKNALGGQWASVVDSIDGHPGAYAHYKPGVGVELSANKMGGLSIAQTHQVMAHELGHLMHKVHGLAPDSLSWQNQVMGLYNSMAPDLKKLYSYYATHPDELWAEIVGQAINPSPVTSQGVAAGPFRLHFQQWIDEASNLVKAKFLDVVPAALESGPVMPGIGEIAGKPTSIGGYAKALIQQGMPDGDVLAAVHAEFPSAKTTMNSIKSYKSELKKAEQGAIGTPGPTVQAHASASIETPKPLTPVASKVDGHADPAAAPTSPPPPTVPLSGLTKVGGKPGGSNPGALYNDVAGNQWLVKGNVQKANGSVTAELSDARARNEVLAARLIRFSDKGLAPEMKLVDLEGQYGGGAGVASRMLDKPIVKFNPENAAHLEIAQRDFALHAWLGNYDVVGASFDNLVMKAGKAVNIDPGGALLFRAQGLLKDDFGEVADTWATMRSSAKNANAAKVYGPMNIHQLKASAQALLAYTDEVIDELVGQMGPNGVPVSNYQLAKTLKARRDDILGRVGLEMPKTTAVHADNATASMSEKAGKLTPSQLDNAVGHAMAGDDQAIILQFHANGVTLTQDELAAFKNMATGNGLNAPATTAAIADSPAAASMYTKINLMDNSELEHAMEALTSGEVSHDGVKSILSDYGVHLNEAEFEAFKESVFNAGVVPSGTPKGFAKFTEQPPGVQKHLQDLANTEGVSPEEWTKQFNSLTGQNLTLGEAQQLYVSEAFDTYVPKGFTAANTAPKALSVADYKAMTPSQLSEALIPSNLSIDKWGGATKKAWTVQQAVIPLFKAGLKTETVWDALAVKFGPENIPKTTSLASLKSKLKKMGLLEGPVGAAPSASNLKQPALWTKSLGSKSTTVKDGAKNMIQQGSDAQSVTNWIATQFSSPNPKGAQDLYELAHYEVVTGKKKPGVQAVLNHGSSHVSMAEPKPLRIATRVGDAGPPPPLYDAEGRRAGLQKYGGLGYAEQNSTLFDRINKGQRAAGLEELTAEEFSAIKAYTGSAYGAVNRGLRTGQFAEDHYLAAWADAGMHGLRKLPARPGWVVRGINVNASDVRALRQFYKPGAIVEETQFLSTSAEDRGGKGFHGNVRYRIMNRTGPDVKPISSFKGEEEILLVPGTRYRVLSIEPNPPGSSNPDSGMLVTMEEV